MLTGLNEKLKKALHRENGADYKEEQLYEIFDLLAACTATGEEWLVPFQMLDSDEDTETASAPEELPALFDESSGFRMTPLMNSDGERLLAAFTDVGAIADAGALMPPMTLKYPVKKLMEEFLADDSCSALVINPGENDFRLTRETVEDVLRAGKNEPPMRWHRNFEAELEPCGKLDVKAIIAAWNEGWEDSGTEEEPWKLVCYPIMPDGTVLAAFAQCADTYGEGEKHSFSRFRILRFTPENGFSEPIDRFRFSGQDMSLSSVFLNGDRLYAAVSRENKKEYSVLQVVPNDDAAQYRIFSNAISASAGKNGDYAVAYTNNKHDKEHTPLVIFNSEGEVIHFFTDRNVLEVSALNHDCKGSLWFYTFPGANLYEVNEDYSIKRCHMLGTQGINDFCITDGGELLVARYGWREESAFYVVPVDAAGDYIFPINLSLKITGDDGKPVDESECTDFGSTSSRGSKMLLNVDGTLYYFDFNELLDDRMKLFLPKRAESED